MLALALEANDSLTDVALSWNGFGHRMPSELRQDSDDEEEEEAEAVQTGSASRYPTIAALKSALQAALAPILDPQAAPAVLCPGAPGAP